MIQTIKDHIDNLSINIQKDLSESYRLSDDNRELYINSLNYAVQAIKILDTLEKLDLDYVPKKCEGNKMKKDEPSIDN